jgi:transposase
MLFKSRAEKVDYVIRLCEEGKNIREIAKEVHMSFGSIGAIIRRVEGHDINEIKVKQEENNISKAAQALKLFSKGKNLWKLLLN